MKSVLISIKPKWCELIASGKKTVEVRKTRPKIDTPFKCYIYCTSSNVHECLMLNRSGAKLIHSINYKKAIPCGGHIGNGKVIGEFVCTRIDTMFRRGINDNFDYCYLTLNTFGNDDIAVEITDIEKSCISKEDLSSYAGKSRCIYGWHISNLVIYYKPKELSEFYIYCGDNPTKCDGCEAHYYSNTECGKEDYCCSVIEGHKPLKRPPQSWCYVSEHTHTEREGVTDICVGGK